MAHHVHEPPALVLNIVPFDCPLCIWPPSIDRLNYSQPRKLAALPLNQLQTSCSVRLRANCRRQARAACLAVAVFILGASFLDDIPIQTPCSIPRSASPTFRFATFEVIDLSRDGPWPSCDFLRHLPRAAAAQCASMRHSSPAPSAGHCRVGYLSASVSPATAHFASGATMLRSQSTATIFEASASEMSTPGRQYAPAPISRGAVDGFGDAVTAHR